jgi:hypothetical protein
MISFCASSFVCVVSYVDDDDDGDDGQVIKAFLELISIWLLFVPHGDDDDDDDDNDDEVVPALTPALTPVLVLVAQRK